MKVLILCIGNACRSQMEEQWAGRELQRPTDPVAVHPLAVDVMVAVGKRAT